MREILFRGKIKDNGKWVYGSLVTSDKGAWIFVADTTITMAGRPISQQVKSYVVDEATVGQYTGLEDMNENKIFEGDIMKWSESQPTKHDYDIEDLLEEDFEIEFINGQFACKTLTCKFPSHQLFTDFEPDNGKILDVKVIGNIHETGNSL